MVVASHQTATSFRLVLTFFFFRATERLNEGEGQTEMGSSQSKKPEVQATVVLPQDDPNDPDTYTLLKVLLLGDTPGHEKSVLLLQYTEPEFMETHTSTIGIDFKTHRTHVDGRNVRLQIWGLHTTTPRCCCDCTG